MRPSTSAAHQVRWARPPRRADRGEPTSRAFPRGLESRGRARSFNGAAAGRRGSRSWPRRRASLQIRAIESGVFRSSSRPPRYPSNSFTYSLLDDLIQFFSATSPGLGGASRAAAFTSSSGRGRAASTQGPCPGPLSPLCGSNPPPLQFGELALEHRSRSRRRDSRANERFARDQLEQECAERPVVDSFSSPSRVHKAGRRLCSIVERKRLDDDDAPRLRIFGDLLPSSSSTPSKYASNFAISLERRKHSGGRIADENFEHVVSTGTAKFCSRVQINESQAIVERQSHDVEHLDVAVDELLLV